MLRVLSLGLFAVAQGVSASEKHDDPRASLPSRKAGLWEVTVYGAAPVSGRPSSPLRVQQCTDRAAEPFMLLSVVPVQSNCSKLQVAQTTGQPQPGYDIELVCHVHENQFETRIELIGDLQSAYSGTYATRQPVALTPAVETASFQGRWLGDCKPDQRAGDMVLPNGITVNVVDDVRRAEAHGH